MEKKIITRVSRTEKWNEGQRVVDASKIAKEDE